MIDTNWRVLQVRVRKISIFNADPRPKAGQITTTLTHTHVYNKHFVAIIICLYNLQ